MSKISKISEKSVIKYVGESSVKKGREYVGDGFGQMRRQGLTLKAICYGTLPKPYRVEVTFDANGIADSDCSCPVGGGRCKHVAALLLTWLQDPDDFTEVPEVEQALQNRSKAELIALVNQMLRREPELEMLLEAPTPDGTKGRPVSADVYRRQALAVFRSSSDEWGASSAVAGDLEAILKTAEDFLKRKEYPAVVEVYQGVASAMIDEYESVHDEEGEISSVLNSCAEGLGKCLKEVRDDRVQREGILRSLFHILQMDIEQGGISIADEVPDAFMEDTSPEERRTIANWIRDELANARLSNSDWVAKSYGAMLLSLRADDLDDEQFLEQCRELGLRSSVIDRLLELKRVDEAVEESRKATDYELLHLADLFVNRRQGEQAQRLVDERSRKSTDSRLQDWHRKHAIRTGDKTRQQELTRQLFLTRPNLEDYKRLQKLTEKTDWPIERAELLAPLQKQRDHYLLIQIYLHDKNLDEALKCVKSMTPDCHNYHMKLEVAKAAEKTQPAAALDIYRSYVEGLIDRRGRESYKSAAHYLKKVRDLYKALGETSRWERYIAQLREENKCLSALKEELNRAKL